MQPTKFANNSNIPLSVAAWLAHDDYDYNDDPDVISTTTLIKPIRQTVLSARVAQSANQLPVDIISRLKSRMGQSIHAGLEQTWINNPKLEQVLLSLGVSKRAISAIKINPENPSEDDINVYLEQRIHRKLGNKTISGKFDMCFDGQLEDNKTTGVFTYKNDTKSEDYILQGSIYRWIAPHIITEDTIRIIYIFTDWKAGDVWQQNYPPAPVHAVEYPLMSLAETEKWITNRLKELEKASQLPETDIKYCTDEELWRGSDVWKYYKKSQAEQKKSTKNFENELEAKKYYAEQGFSGELVKVPGEVKACLYCAGFELCSQKNHLIAAGDLKVKT